MLTRQRIVELFEALNEELRKRFDISR